MFQCQILPDTDEAKYTRIGGSRDGAKFEVTPVSLRLHFHVTSITTQVHFGRFHFKFMLISLRFNVDDFSVSLNSIFDVITDSS